MGNNDNHHLATNLAEFGGSEDFLRYSFCDKSDVKAFRLPAGTSFRGWSGGAMVLGKLPVPGRPTNLDDSRARAYCSCSRCGWGLFGYFYSQLSFLSSFSISLGDGPI